MVVNQTEENAHAIEISLNDKWEVIEQMKGVTTNQMGANIW